MNMIKPQQEQLANDAFEDYVFGDAVRIVAADPWSCDTYDGADDFVKVAYATYTEDGRDADSHKISFHVKFFAGTASVSQVYAYECDFGNEIGGPGKNTMLPSAGCGF